MPLLTRAARPIVLDLAPVEVAARCRRGEGLVFFDSARADDGAEISIVAVAPSQIVRGRSDADWQRLREILASKTVAVSPDDGLPHGFATGCVDYDGTFCFGIYDDLMIHRHRDQSWYAVGNLPSHLHEPRAPASAAAPQFSSQTSPAEFCRRVARAQEYIASGDIYQVNISHCFRAAWEGDAFAFYEALRHYSPAPFAAFLELEGRSVLSSSPELFLKMSGRAIRTRPIKGTRPRRAEATADEKSAYDLMTSPKEVAELVMITDLERNDLGQVCAYGSVRASELLKLERYEQVFHLVSTVDGQLRPEVDHVAALRACFPGGSITGAPKKRAREIIAELETEPRGLYTGAIGWLGFNGESQFNIAIRTVVVENGEARFHVGAGVVADSQPAAEWQETLDKAAGILLAAELMESAPRPQ